MSIDKKRTQFTHPAGGSALHIKINPGAKENKIRRIDADGFMLIDISCSSASDERGNANVIEFFSQLFNIPQRQIEIAGGAEGTEKLICIFGVSVDALNRVINEKMGRIR